MDQVSHLGHILTYNLDDRLDRGVASGGGGGGGGQLPPFFS